MEHMDHGDLVIDFDLIGQALSQQSKDGLPDNLVETVASVRDHLYQLVETEKVDARNIWIIASLPQAERA